MDIKPLKYLSEILMSLLFVNDKTSEIIKQIKIMQIKKNKMNLKFFYKSKKFLNSVRFLIQ
jgi:hypothetical protein